MRYPRLEGAIAFADDQDLTIQVVASPLRTITIAAGEYYPSELLAAIEAAALAHAELATFAAELDAGKAKLTIPAAGTLTWVDADVKAALRFTAATLTAGATTAAQQCRGVYRSSLPVADDRRIDRRSASVLLSAESADVHAYGTRWHRMISLRATGNERSGAADELRALRLFWSDYFGAVVRYYPDETIAVAFNEDSAPYGYHTIRIIGPVDFDPSRPQANFWGRWLLNIEAVETQ